MKNLQYELFVIYALEIMIFKYLFYEGGGVVGEHYHPILY